MELDPDTTLEKHRKVVKANEKIEKQVLSLKEKDQKMVKANEKIEKQESQTQVGEGNLPANRSDILIDGLGQRSVMELDPTIDTTLIFERSVLEKVFAQASPYVVKLNMEPSCTGFMVGSTFNQTLVAVDSSVLTKLPKSVQFYDQKKAALVQKSQKLPGSSITILFTERVQKRLASIKFADLDPNNDVCQKVVTLFPYMNGAAMFEGHILLKDCTSMGRDGMIRPASADLFAFSCTYAALHNIACDPEEEKLQAEHLQKIAGAAVFNLNGEVVGVLSSYSRGYDVKLAKRSSYFKEHFDKLVGKQVKLMKG